MIKYNYIKNALMGRVWIKIRVLSSRPEFMFSYTKFHVFKTKIPVTGVRAVLRVRAVTGVRAVPEVRAV